MEELLFESTGAPEKRKKILTILGGLILACGAILLLLCMVMPSYVDGKGILTFFSVMVLAVGVVFLWMPQFDFTNKAYLRIYADHVEGRQVSPTKEFSLKFEQIYNVKKTDLMGNEFLVIQAEKEAYAVLVDDRNLAYNMINAKLDELESI